jgi:hypothetical protein
MNTDIQGIDVTCGRETHRNGDAELFRSMAVVDCGAGDRAVCAVAVDCGEPGVWGFGEFAGDVFGDFADSTGALPV